MPQSWRVYLAVIGAALCWLGVAFVVLPLLGDPVSFNKVSSVASHGATQASQANNQAPVRSFSGNVYHIIFDGYQSQAYQYFLDKTPELGQLPFTYFPNFRINSSATYLSLAELFASDFYTPNVSVERWHNAAFQTGMLDYLANGGVKLNLYPHYPENCYGGASAVCTTRDDLTKDLLGEGRVRQTALDLWFLKLIPGSLKRELNARFAPQDQDTSDGDSPADWGYGFSIFNAIAPSETPLDSEKPYFSVQQFLRSMDAESSRSASGQYIYWHVILPHGAFVLDRECAYIGRIAQAERTPQADQVRYLEQVQCANKLLTLLMNRLASMGRLDDALIVVQADHGNYLHPVDLGVLYQYDPLDVSVPRVDSAKDDSSTWSSELIEVKASALLLVKFPGQSAASRSDKPVEMIDIAPTILHYFGIEPPRSMLGIPVQDMPASPARDRLFFVANAIPDPHNPKVLSRYRYVDGRWKFEENITTFTGTDQLFTITLGAGH